MSNQLTKLFDMTDTRDVPDAAIEAVAKAAGWEFPAHAVHRDAAKDYSFDRLILALLSAAMQARGL